MMEFTTRAELPKPTPLLHHDQKTLLLGSCFADNIGNQLLLDQFDCLVNPFGVLYNPASICAHLLRCLSQKEYTADAPEVFRDGTLAHSWMHHSSFSAASTQSLVEHMNRAMHTTAQFLSQAHLLIVTFGTSYIYRLRENGMLVSNCHKQPDRLFVRQRLSCHDIVDAWLPLLQLLHACHPQLQVVFTLSPVRHKRDGFHHNQLSKAELLLAIDQLCQPADAHAALPTTHYFPAYEILLDQLRDYRFYADDMVHPSTLAINYIYQQFALTYMSEQERQLAAHYRRLAARQQHREIIHNA